MFFGPVPAIWLTYFVHWLFAELLIYQGKNDIILVVVLKKREKESDEKGI